jgi:endo-1,4-beta-xylanase
MFQLLNTKAFSRNRFASLAVITVMLVGCDGGSSGGSGVLTQGPGADDEPIAELSDFNTASGFTVVREPGPRLAEEADVEYTLEDFNAGLPAIELQVPTGLDTSLNQPPGFVGLQNITVLAGDLVEVIYDPIDPEGELPGMFPEELPQGGSFDDNFDGSKTFRWQPLQMDVGINAFTVTALDPANSLYRASQTIFINVELPQDPATIPNVAPMLDELLPHTVRVNDPVVIELKGIDLNGSVPTLEIPDLPAGATLNPHPRFAEIYVLKFVPTSVGTASIDVLARDSVDTSLTSTETIEINVLAESAFESSGQSLRALADARGLRIGFAALESFYHRPDGAIYAAIAAREFNFVTPENSMKMDQINPLPGRFQFAATDNLVAFAKSNNMEIHAHPIIWHRQLPAWIEQANPANLEQHMSEYIDRLMTRYKDDMIVWDVVNEPLADNGAMRESVWYQAIGEDYIDKAFTQARSLAPAATLLLNEFDISFDGPKVDGLLALLDRLIAREVPIDGVGFQMHLFASYDQFSELEGIFAQIESRDLDIYITELDVSLDGGASLAQQASVYQNVVSLCLAQPRCVALQTWGLTDQYSFRSIFDPLLFDREYQAKPAYDAVQGVLADTAQ